MKHCHKCQSSNIIKRGIHCDKQRYKCKSCGFQSINVAALDPNERRKKLLRAICLFLSGLSKNAVGKLMGVSCQAVCDWILEMGDYESLMPKPTGEFVSIEMDEMWHFHNSKEKKLWIWKAYCRETGQLIGFTFGDRDTSTLMDLISKLAGYKVKIFYTDDFGPYQKLIPEHMLMQSKAETVAIERNNGRQRHWLAAFRRRSIVVTKSLKILESTLALFAYYHINNDFTELIKISMDLSA